MNDFNQGFLQTTSTNYNIFKDIHINVRGVGGFDISLETDCNDNLLEFVRVQSSDDGNVTGFLMKGFSNTLMKCTVEGGTTDPSIGLDVAAITHDTVCIGC